MVNPRVAIGIDFGTLSGRAVVVCVDDGRELGSAVSQYSHGVITQQLPNGRLLGPSWALQSPADWRAVLSEAVPAALASSGALSYSARSFISWWMRGISDLVA